MKCFAALLLMLVGSSAHADCQESWLEYSSPTLSLHAIYSGGCYDGPLILEFSQHSRHRPLPPTAMPVQSIPFDRECQLGKKDENGETIAFSCRKDGVSPLAGATYRFKLIKTTIVCDGVKEPDWAHTFVCVKGCKPATPKRLEVPFGEGCA